MSDPARPLVQVEVASADAGPRRATTLLSRHAPLAAPEEQRRHLSRLDLGTPADFEADLRSAGWPELSPGPIEIFQINVGKLCNMTCAHCHVDAGPDRVAENMTRATMEDCLRALDATGARAVDITGGAPELNPHFRWLVDQCAARGKHVIDRCNLTVLLLSRNRDLPAFFAERGVEVVCSLPHYRRVNTDAQRGDGAYEKSIAALRLLNAAGYGEGDPRRRLTLMSNPAGAFLAGNQHALEREWKAALIQNHGVRFDRLICLNNMPISRFLEWLESTGNVQAYMCRLVAAFNPAAVGGLMCRNTLSVSWDGRLFDCDFNQMLDLEVAPPGGPMHVRDLDTERLLRRRVVTGRHCYGCTAGQGSSCAGATT
jgi:radical SAM/Cys-rich protein